MNEFKKEFGKRLAEIRKSKKIKQEELREMINAPTIQMISGWENGRSFPSAIYLIILAKKLDISLDYLLLGKQTSSRDVKIRTYKDVAMCMIELVNQGLFDLKQYLTDLDGHYVVKMETKNVNIRNFKLEYDNLLVASKTLRPELFEQAVKDLLEKYDIPIKLNKK